MYRKLKLIGKHPSGADQVKPAILISIIAVSFLLLNACGSREEGFTVSGKLENGHGQMIYLKRMTSTEMLPVDSTLIDTGGHFMLRGSSDFMNFYALHTLPESFIYLLAMTGDEIMIEGDANDLPRTYQVDGSDDSRYIRELTLRQNRTLDGIYRLNQIFQDSLENRNFETIKSNLDSTFNALIESQLQFTYYFIHEHINSQASLMALYQQMGPRSWLLDPEKDFRYFAMVDSSLIIRYPESDAVQDLHRQVEEISQKRRMEAINEARLGIGAEAPEIALPDPEGDTIALSSLRGKVVLLDFWASWCPPCRKENPNLVRLYKKYQNEGFEIYQVSLDKSMDAWKRAIRQDQLDWVNVSDLQMWNAVVVPVYNIQGIPMSFLLDRNGKILASNLKGVMLERKMEEIFKR